MNKKSDTIGRGENNNQMVLFFTLIFLLSNSLPLQEMGKAY